MSADPRGFPSELAASSTAGAFSAHPARRRRATPAIRSWDAAVVIVTFNSSEYIGRCLEPLTGRRVVVVDNASTDDTCRIISTDFPDVQLVRQSENLGLANAFNIGWRLVPGRHVFLLNPDVEVTRDGLDRLLGALVRLPRAGVVAPRLVHADGSVQPSARSFPTLTAGIARRTPIGRTRWGKRQLREHLRGLDSESGWTAVDWVLGAAMLIRADALVHLGGYDERYFLYCEDSDFCARAWGAGFQTVYCSDVTFVHHYQRQSRRTLNFTSRATRAHWRSTIRLASTYPANYLGRPLRSVRQVDVREHAGMPQHEAPATPVRVR